MRPLGTVLNSEPVRPWPEAFLPMPPVLLCCPAAPPALAVLPRVHRAR